MINEQELYHYGVMGMKWGVRKHQKKEGSRIGTSDNLKTKKKISKKKIAAITATTLTIATAATLYGKNPVVRKAVNKSVSKLGKTTISALKKGSKRTVEIGKKYTKEAVKSAKEGVKEGIKEAPKRAAKAIVVGAGMNIAKKMLDSAIGKEESAKIFKANNGKKIDSFWKVGPDDKDDRDD